MKSSILALLFCSLAYGQAVSQNAEKFDEFEETPCDEYLGRMDSAFANAHENPNTALYILIYEGKERSWSRRKNQIEWVFPTRRSVATKISSMKRYINLRKFPIDRVRIIRAGFRKHLSLEIWLVPRGAEPPKATPTLAKMKYRKGKAEGFCLWCCE